MRIAASVIVIVLFAYLIKYHASPLPIRVIMSNSKTAFDMENPLYTKQCVVWYLSPTKGE